MPSDEVFMQADREIFQLNILWEFITEGSAQLKLAITLSALEKMITDAFYHLGMLYFDMIRGGSGLSSLITIYASLASDGLLQTLIFYTYPMKQHSNICSWPLKQVTFARKMLLGSC